jgi:hypothetical protein
VKITVKRGRYEVVATYRGRRAPMRGGARFRRLSAAIKERDRQRDQSQFRVRTAADLLGDGSFDYTWRVWDHRARRYADKSPIAAAVVGGLG